MWDQSASDVGPKADLMGLPPNAPFQCLSCRRGDFVTCANQVINGISVDGGYAEYATLRTEALSRIPDNSDAAESAALLCAGVTVYNSLRHMKILPGEICAVQGVGGLGHLALQFSKKMGTFNDRKRTTVALSQNDSKAQLAKELGADIYLDASKVDQVEELNKLGGDKVIIAVAPSGKAMAELIPALSVGGQLVVLAVPHDGLAVNAMHLIQKRRSIVGWPSGTAQDSEETIAFAEHAGVKTSIEKFPLDQVQEGFDRMSENKVRFRAVLTFD
ncbi:BZ3500_MvSof-1268-A1-R1_Chr11-2g03435 [Microbotryum saponariae]|uniref:BZ3500_MvSof-1268-A1-R1_Chr11-2g03435 protein n=1 Tax=Microbotryum saponariae TaxID=289078 RepID=A0A2X0LCC2_9BASI|nr:BZ3500_MvSof-1268-A1-R1_Chr11-2g03435 [Microbotryum saponariae]SDA03369.1 BZ3501_MvSof-1269-A2-R1_Chr11g03006 [Microbotryum saponariae]